MKLSKLRNAVIQITGINKDKGIINGLMLGPKPEPIGLKFSNTSKSRDFVSVFSDESHPSYAPVGSIIHARFLNQISESANLYAGASASILLKPESKNKAYVAPIKVYDDFTTLPSDFEDGGTYKVLFANVLDEDFSSIRRLNDLADTMVSILEQPTLFTDKARRGALIRIGYQKKSGEKQAIPVEFIPQKGVPLRDEVLKFVHHSPDLAKALDVGKDALLSPRGLMEVTGFSRVIVNDYKNSKNVEKYINNKAFVGDRGRAYTLASIVSDDKGKINVINVFDPKLNSVSGHVGVHSNDKDAFYNLDYIAPAEQKQINVNYKYPLRYKEIINSSGKRSGIAIEGDESLLKKHKDTIVSAVAGITPIKQPNTNQYIFPIADRDELLSNLSALLGTPALYTTNVSKSQRYPAHFKLAGHTTVPFFKKSIDKIAEQYKHSVVNDELYFPLSQRIEIESKLKPLLALPLLQKTYQPKTPKITYAQWLEDTYMGNVNKMMDDLYSEISDVAEQMGIDWSATAPSVFVPPAGSKGEMFKGSKTVKVLKPGHAGSAAVLVSAGYLPIENKFSNTTDEILTITVKFYNKKMNSGAGEIAFNSFHTLLDEYNRDVGKGKT
jgi:hypothetical protein